MDAKTKLERFDGWQQQRRVPAVALATMKKFQEDQTTNLAGLIAFWAFFSVFPLMLAFVTVLAYATPSDTKGKVLTDVGNVMPVLRGQHFNTLTGSWWALLVGVLSALWSGMGVVRTAQSAFNSVWEVPMNQRPKFVEKTVRALKILGTVGVGLVLSTVLTGFVQSTVNHFGPGPLSAIIGDLLALPIDVGLFIAAFRMLTDREITTKQVLPGAILSGTVFWILQLASSLIIGRYLHNAKGTYGTMAGVITMLWWFYLQAIVTLLGAQLNVVLTHRLWPRSLVGGPDTRADHRAYEAYAQERTYHDNEQVDATFHPQPQQSNDNH